MLRRVLAALTRFLPLILLRVAGAGITGGLAVYVARVYGAEFSGRFFLFVSSITIISVLTRLGAEPYLTSHVAPMARTGPLAGSRYLASTAVAVAVLVGVAAFVLSVLMLVAEPFSSRLLGETPLPLLIGAAMGVNLIWLAGAYCRSIGWATLSILIETGLLYLWLFVLLEIIRATSVPLTVANVALGVALLLPILLTLFAVTFWRKRRNLITALGIVDALKGVVSFGAVTVTNGIIMLIPLQVLGFQGLANDAGVYNAALRVSMFVGAFGVVIKSAIVRQEARAPRRTEDRQGDVVRSAAMSVPFVILSVTLASQSQFMTALFGPDFSGIESIILIMLLAQCVSVAGNVVETRAVLAKETRSLNVTAVVTLIVALVAAPVLVRSYGLSGAAWAFAATVCASRLTLALLYLRGPRTPSRV